MNAPPFPIAPEVGDWFQNWVWNGARWVASPTTGLRVLVQVFWQSGPYMPSPGLVSLIVECIGGGGAGGWVAPYSGSYGGSGGGGSGGYSRKALPAALVRGGILVTVGAGGTAPVGSAQASGSGGVTSFGALCMANGGGGAWPYNPTATAGQPVSNGDAGSGPDGGVGDLSWSGNPGEFWTTLALPDGAGGSTTLAQAGRGATIMAGGASTVSLSIGGSGPGLPGDVGAGGSGAQSNDGAQYDGGEGGGGRCIVTEYCWGDRDQPDVGWRPPLDVNVSFPKPPWPGGQPGPWPPGAWWPPGGWWGPGPWPPSPGGPRPREAVEFEAGQTYDQSINPQTGEPWEDEP